MAEKFANFISSLQLNQSGFSDKISKSQERLEKFSDRYKLLNTQNIEETEKFIGAFDRFGTVNEKTITRLRRERRNLTKEYKRLKDQELEYDKKLSDKKLKLAEIETLRQKKFETQKQRFAIKSEEKRINEFFKNNKEYYKELGKMQKRNANLKYKLDKRNATYAKKRRNEEIKWQNSIKRFLSFQMKALTTGLVMSTAFKGIQMTGEAFDKFIEVNSMFEKSLIQMERVYGSKAKSIERLNSLIELSALPGFTLEEWLEAEKVMANIGISTEKYLKILANASIALEKPLNQAVEAFKDAMVGKYRSIKEFGITAVRDGSNTILNYTNKFGEQVQKTVDRYNRAMVQTKIAEIFEEKYSGALEKMSQTFEAAVKGFQKEINLLFKGVGDDGVFNVFKEVVNVTSTAIRSLRQNLADTNSELNVFLNYYKSLAQDALKLLGVNAKIGLTYKENVENIKKQFLIKKKFYENEINQYNLDKQKIDLQLKEIKNNEEIKKQIEEQVHIQNNLNLEKDINNTKIIENREELKKLEKGLEQINNLRAEDKDNIKLEERRQSALKKIMKTQTEYAELLIKESDLQSEINKSQNEIIELEAPLKKLEVQEESFKRETRLNKERFEQLKSDFINHLDEMSDIAKKDENETKKIRLKNLQRQIKEWELEIKDPKIKAIKEMRKIESEEIIISESLKTKIFDQNEKNQDKILQRVKNEYKTRLKLYDDAIKKELKGKEKVVNYEEAKNKLQSEASIRAINDANKLHLKLLQEREEKEQKQLEKEALQRKRNTLNYYKDLVKVQKEEQKFEEESLEVRMENNDSERNKEIEFFKERAEKLKDVYEKIKNANDIESRDRENLERKMLILRQENEEIIRGLRLKYIKQFEGNIKSSLLGAWRDGESFFRSMTMRIGEHLEDQLAGSIARGLTNSKAGASISNVVGGVNDWFGGLFRKQDDLSGYKSPILTIETDTDKLVNVMGKITEGQAITQDEANKVSGTIISNITTLGF